MITSEQTRHNCNELADWMANNMDVASLREYIRDDLSATYWRDPSAYMKAHDDYLYMKP